MRKLSYYLGLTLLLSSQLINAQDIFKQHGFDKKPLTLSNGRFNEFFNNEEIVQIGTVLLNTKTNEVFAFVDEDTAKATYLAELSSRWLSIDPLAAKYPEFSPYVYVNDNPIIHIDPDGREAYVVVFPDYKISTPLGKIGGLGHAGSLIINPSTGAAYYVEYGRYDAESKGITRTLSGGHQVGTVEFGENGLPTEASLSGVFKTISDEAGHGGRIEAAEVSTTQDEFNSMLNTQENMLQENSNADRAPYELKTNNCGTKSCKVITDNKENSGVSSTPNPRPVKMIQETQKTTTRVGYDSKTGTTVRGGTYRSSADEKETDKKVGN